MDVLYYSNYCKHSQKLLQYLVKNNLINKVNCIWIDKRVRDYNTSQIYIVMENGQRLLLPTNINSVPALLMVNNKYTVIVGEDIYKYFGGLVNEVQRNMPNGGEPMGYPMTGPISNGNIVSEQYTYYNMSPEELRTSGKGGMRQMYNYIPASHEQLTICTPPEDYRPDKVTMSMEDIQSRRNQELQGLTVPPPAGVDLSRASYQQARGGGYI